MKGGTTEKEKIARGWKGVIASVGIFIKKEKIKIHRIKKMRLNKRDQK